MRRVALPRAELLPRARVAAVACNSPSGRARVTCLSPYPVRCACGPFVVALCDTLVHLGLARQSRFHHRASAGAGGAGGADHRRSGDVRASAGGGSGAAWYSPNRVRTKAGSHFLQRRSRRRRRSRTRPSTWAARWPGSHGRGRRSGVADLFPFGHRGRWRVAAQLSQTIVAVAVVLLGAGAPLRCSAGFMQIPSEPTAVRGERRVRHANARPPRGASGVVQRAAAGCCRGGDTWATHRSRRSPRASTRGTARRVRLLPRRQPPAASRATGPVAPPRGARSGGVVPPLHLLAHRGRPSAAPAGIFWPARARTPTAAVLDGRAGAAVAAAARAIAGAAASTAYLRALTERARRAAAGAPRGGGGADAAVVTPSGAAGVALLSALAAGEIVKVSGETRPGVAADALGLRRGRHHRLPTAGAPPLSRGAPTPRRRRASSTARRLLVMRVVERGADRGRPAKTRQFEPRFAYSRGSMTGELSVTDDNFLGRNQQVRLDVANSVAAAPRRPRLECATHASTARSPSPPSSSARRPTRPPTTRPPTRPTPPPRPTTRRPPTAGVRAIGAADDAVATDRGELVRDGRRAGGGAEPAEPEIGGRSGGELELTGRAGAHVVWRRRVGGARRDRRRLRAPPPVTAKVSQPIFRPRDARRPTPTNTNTPPPPTPHQHQHQHDPPLARARRCSLRPECPDYWRLKSAFSISSPLPALVAPVGAALAPPPPACPRGVDGAAV